MLRDHRTSHYGVHDITCLRESDDACQCRASEQYDVAIVVKESSQIYAALQKSGEEKREYMELEREQMKRQIAFEVEHEVLLVVIGGTIVRAASRTFFPVSGRVTVLTARSPGKKESLASSMIENEMLSYCCGVCSQRQHGWLDESCLAACGPVSLK